MARIERTTPLGRWRPAAGFTLVEVLVALAVLATVMTALIMAGGQRADGINHLRDRTLATWIAADRITELRLESSWPEPGVREQIVHMNERAWAWRAEIRETPAEGVRRVDVEVRLADGDGVLARVEGYLGDPADRGAGAPAP